MANTQERPSVALETLGCRLNQAETEELARRFLAAGYRLAHPGEGADIYILNTCTVTGAADRKARRWLRWARRQSPSALIVAAGCYAERAAGEVSRIPGVDLALGNVAKEGLVSLVQERVGAGAEGEKSRPLPLRSRPQVKLQEGCTLGCTYCIVPRVRGPERSVPTPQVMSQVAARAAEGYPEVVLTGTLIGTYRGQGMDLTVLLERLLAETPVRRLRLSSLLPQDLSPPLLRLWGTGRLCRHLHLPLQSGSPAVLEGMGRPYSLAQYEEAVVRAREAVPDLALTTDVMVGFPGEGEAEFEESYRFCQRTGFARIHVFPYSRRPGTPATARLPQVMEGVKRERARRLLELAQESTLQFHRRFLGRTLPVLWGEEKEGVWAGLTDNYLRVFTSSPQDLRRRLTRARLVAPYRDGLWGEAMGHVP